MENALTIDHFEIGFGLIFLLMDTSTTLIVSHFS